MEQDIITIDDAVTVLPVLEAGENLECDPLWRGVHCQLELVAVLAVFGLGLSHLEVGPRVDML